MFSGDASFTRLCAKEELATSVGEAVDVMCPEHNLLTDQASNKIFIEKDKWISSSFE